MSKKQKEEEILEFLQNYIQTENIAPSVREICEGVGVRSTSTVHRYLHRMEQEGKIHMNSGKKRAIFVSETIPDGIPVIEKIQPETGFFDESNIKTKFHFISEKKHHYPLFSFCLKKDHPDFGFLKGDMLIAEKTSLRRYGRLIVFLTETGEPDITDDEIPDSGSAVGTVVSLVRNF